MLKHGKVLKKMEKWGPEFKISFTIQLLDGMATTRNKLLNVFHLSATDHNCCNKGDRIPGVWVVQKEDGPKLRIDIAMPSHQSHEVDLVLNQNHSITLTQNITTQNITTDGFFTVHVDGKVVWELPTTPDQYKDVIWYLSNPWDPTAEGKISLKHLSISNNNG